MGKPNLNAGFLTLILAGMLFNFSCDKNDPDPECDCSMTIAGEDFNIISGQLVYYGIVNESPDSYNFDIRFIDDGLVYDNEEGAYTGSGAGLSFEMFSETNSDLQPGVYYYDYYETGSPYTFYYAYAYTGYNPSEGKINMHYIADGTVTVAKKGDHYKISFDCILENGNSLTGSFDSELEYIDNSDMKK